MKNVHEAATLSEKIERDESRYRTTLQAEQQILNGTTSPGFAPAWERVRLMCERQGLPERIRRNKIMLAWARS
jgi:hypothetical protein